MGFAGSTHPINYGFLLGLGFGWLPAMLLTVIAYALFPFTWLALLVVGIVIGALLGVKAPKTTYREFFQKIKDKS